MKQKYEGKDLQGLVDLGREQGYLTFDQVNDFLPQDVTSPTDLRSALDSFEDMDIKVLDDVPADGVDGELEAEVKEESEEVAETTTPADEGDRNLVELAVYGVASLYERYPPRPPVDPNATKDQPAPPK